VANDRAVVYYNKLPCYVVEENVDGNEEKIRLKGAADTWCKGGFITLRRRVTFPEPVSPKLSVDEYRLSLKSKTLEQLQELAGKAAVDKYSHLTGALATMAYLNYLTKRYKENAEAEMA
jgi:hypothetical protein